ncbi:60s ribosomal protein l7, mitochondrial precursor [Kockovaella imperatae]|uniref:60s ribosomal protein l7, mitochondrial n=1 Tax=Kockovaella imperatae TaxID=4999 RepID=A0A1Y1U6L7_9TREE|nr:60s ribosomal protein l7, mitochondrial precursor [Kockovaella imperatae]ORX33679.1 60s ribosomal protein l7, mitochondrial precursor [Kockovaella imperatae]
MALRRSLAASSALRTAIAGPSTLPARRFLATPVESFPLPYINLGQTHLARYHEHYDTSLATDLMYMNYDHRVARTPPRPLPEMEPLTRHEANQPRYGHKVPLQNLPVTVDKIPRLEKITLHTMNRKAVESKHHLLPTIMAFRAISGESINGGGRTASTGVSIRRAKTGAARWRLREGMPIGALVEIKGEAMYDFVQSLVDFVLPRLREFRGVGIEAPPSPHYRNASSGTVQFGFEPNAMGLFPQIEANIDQYPNMYGFTVAFHTNARGPRAQAMARSLLSGFRIPFIRQ